MKTKITLFNLLIIMLLTLEAQASNIFVVSGKVMKSDVSLAQDGLLVTVENTRTGVVRSGKQANLALVSITPPFLILLISILKLKSEIL
ncbi:hypothetical protein H8E77_27085 [bacterium]|nr:hypothetical protein [bacterium]